MKGRIRGAIKTTGIGDALLFSILISFCLFLMLWFLFGHKNSSTSLILMVLTLPLLVIAGIRITLYITHRTEQFDTDSSQYKYLKDYTTHPVSDYQDDNSEYDPIGLTYLELMRICYFPEVETEILKIFKAFSLIKSDKRYAREVDIATEFVESAVKLVRGFLSLARTKDEFACTFNDESDKSKSELYANQQVVIKKLNSINETLVSIINIHTQDLVDSLDKLELPVFNLTLRRRVSDLINRSEKLISSISNENHDTVSYTTEDVFILKKLVDSELENIYSLFVNAEQAHKDDALRTSTSILNRIDSYITDLEAGNTNLQKTESLQNLLITEKYFETRIPDAEFLKADRSK